MKINSRDSLIEKLSLEKDLVKAKNRSNKIIIFFLTLSLFLFGGVIYNYKKKNLVLKEIDKQNKIIYTKNKELKTLVNRLEKNNVKLIKSKETVEELLKLNERTLFSKVLKISAYNDTITKTIKQISNLTEKRSYKEIKSNDLFSIEKSLNSIINEDDIWNDFKIQFEKTRPDFFKKLKKYAPDLSVNDLKHCSYIIAKLNTKDVANLINISPRSVETSRYRLKKKLNLNKEINLFDFLQKFN